MAARKHREVHDFQQSKKMVPLITHETTFGEQVSKLVLGVNIFDSDLGVQVESAKQPALRNSVGSGHVSHHWTSVFDDRLDHRFIVLKNVQLRFTHFSGL